MAILLSDLQKRASDENKQAQSYIGKGSHTIHKNWKLRRVLDALLTDSHIKIIQRHPVALQWISDGGAIKEEESNSSNLGKPADAPDVPGGTFKNFENENNDKNNDNSNSPQQKAASATSATSANNSESTIYYPKVPDCKTPAQTALAPEEEQQSATSQPKPKPIKIKKCPVEGCRFRSAFIGAIDQCLRYKHGITDESQINALKDKWADIELAEELLTGDEGE